MGPETLVLMIPIAAIVMVGLVKIARIWATSIQARGGTAVPQLESRVEAMEQELASLQHDLSETQERLDFAERLLAQAREGKRLGAPD